MSIQQTKAFDISGNSRLKSISSRFAKKSEQPTGSASPAVKDDLVARMNLDRRHEISDGLPAILDVQPDFAPIFMVLVYYASTWYSSLDQKNHAKLSPGTIMAYFFTIIYAHILVCDTFVRPTPSRHSDDFMKDFTRREFLKTLLSLPVPTFLVKILDVLTPAKDPRRENVEFIPSFAGFSHHHDFGRFFPVNIFIMMHHVAASVKSNSDPDAIFQYFLALPVSTTINTHVGNYFGALFEHSGTHYNLDSKLMQALSSVFNPAVLRSLSQRAIFSKIPQVPHVLATSDYNPYIFLLNCDDNHISEMSTLLESISSAVSDSFPMSGQLGTRYDNLSGIAITRHGITQFCLPTHHYKAITTMSKVPASATISDHTAKDRATALKFLVAPTWTGTNTIVYPKDDSTIDTNLYLVNKKAASDNTERYPLNPEDYMIFKSPENVYPRIRIFDAYDYNAASFNTVILAGLIIYTLEIDGFTVPHANIHIPLDDENSFLLQSALPMSRIRRATNFNGTDTHSAIRRARHDASAQPVSVSLYNMFWNILPSFDHATDDTFPASGELYGFTPVDRVSQFFRAFSKFGFLTKNIENKNDADTKPPAPLGMVYAWSPYRYVALNKPTTRSDSTYMLLDFRTIYGTNVTLGEIAHYQDVIPIN